MDDKYISRSFICGALDVVPLKFHKYCGLLDHKFLISRPQFFSDKELMCHCLFNDSWFKIIIPTYIFPREVESLNILSKLDGETEREGRYISIYTAYEAIIDERDIDCSSIRHALAHSTTRLSHKNVRESLINRFGGLKIDFRNYYHKKEVYRCIGIMLVQIDKRIHETLTSKWSYVKTISN